MHRIALVIALAALTLVGCDDSKPAADTTPPPAAGGGPAQDLTPAEVRAQGGKGTKAAVPTQNKAGTEPVD